MASLTDEQIADTVRDWIATLGYAAPWSQLTKAQRDDVYALSVHIVSRSLDLLEDPDERRDVMKTYNLMLAWLRRQATKEQSN